MNSRAFWKTGKKLAALILMLTLLFTSIAGNILVSAETTEKAENANAEITEKRDQFTKHFSKDNQTEVAIVSASPLHYKDDEGKWQDIDNTLISEKDAQGNDVFVNEKNDVKVSLPKTLEQGKAVSISSDDYNLSFTMTDTLQANAVKIDVPEQSKTSKNLKEYLDSEIKEPGIQYTNALDQTDIEYKILPNGIKESIIVKQKEKAREQYTHEVNAPGLTAKLFDDNRVEFYTEDGTLKFGMPAPYMFDSAEAPSYSSEIQVDLQEKIDGGFVLTYTPNSEWVKNNTRVYPVTIDPTVNVVNCSKSGVCWGYNFTEPHHLVCYELPQLPAGAVITHAECKVGIAQIVDTNLIEKLEINRILSDWDIDWSGFGMVVEVPDIAAIPEDEYIFNNDELDSLQNGATGFMYPDWECSFDVTDAVEDWYNLEENYGLIVGGGGMDVGQYGLQIEYTTPEVVIAGITKTPEEWTVGAVTVTITASSGSVSMKDYSFDGGETWQIQNSKSFSENCAIEIVARNINDDTDFSTFSIDNIDKEEPIIESLSDEPDGTGNIIVTINATDELSGVKDYCFGSIVDENSWQTSNTKIYEELPQNLIVFVRDNALNISSNIVTINSVTHSPAGWSNQPITVTVNASSMATTMKDYSFDGGETWQSENFAVFSQYEKNIEIIARDYDNNLCKQWEEIKYDATPPEIWGIERTTNEENTPVVRVRAIDTPSGVEEYSFDGGTTWQTEDEKEYVTPPTDVSVVVRDYAGNTASSSLIILGITQSPDTWTTGDVTVTVAASAGMSAIVTDYSFDGGETWQISPTKLFTEFEANVNIAVRDDLGNICAASLPKVFIDREPPVIKPYTDEGNESLFVHVPVTDEESGVDVIKWAVGNQEESYFEGNGTILSQGEPYFDSVDGETYTLYAVDNVGNGIAVSYICMLGDKPEDPEEDLGFGIAAVTAPIPDGIYMIKAKHSNKYLDPSPTVKNCQPVVQWTVHGGARMRWKFTHLGNGYYSIRPIHALSLVLDVTGETVDVYTLNNLDNSSLPSYGQWKIESLGDGSFRFINKSAGNSKFMDVYNNGKDNGAKVTMYKWLGGNNQKFILEKANPVANGTYFIKSLHSRYYMDAWNWGANNNTKITQFALTGGTNQKWVFTYLNNGYYVIRPSYNLKFGIGLTSYTDGYFHTQFADFGTANTSSINKKGQWAIVKNSDDTFSLSNQYTEGVADVKNYSMNQGGELISYPYRDTANQRWLIEGNPTGGASAYKQLTVSDPANCLGYALLQNAHIGETFLTLSLNDNIEQAFNKLKAACLTKRGISISRLANKDAYVKGDQYRVAMRIGQKRGDLGPINDYHFMVQTCTGWADKMLGYPSYLHGWVNPDNSSLAPWVDYTSNTIYFAVTRNSSMEW